MRTHIITTLCYALPNIRTFSFKAVSANSEAVLNRITAENFQICYLEQFTISVPQLLRFMGTHWGELHFCSERVYVLVNSPEANIPVVQWMNFQYMSTAGTSTGRYPPWLKLSTRLDKCCPPRRISLLDTMSIVGHRESTMRSTAPSGVNFLGHLVKQRPFSSKMGSSGNSLVVYDW